MIFQNIKMALVSIRSAKLRSFLTILGIIIGISSVVTVLAVGEGVKSSIREQVTSLGANLIQVNPGQAIDDSGGDDSSSSFNFASSLGTSTLKDSDIEVIKTTKGVDAVAPTTLVSGIVTNQTKSAKNSFIIASTSDYIKAVSQKVATGRFINTDEVATKVIVLGSGAKKDLFGDEDAIGKKVKLRGAELEVIGVMEAVDTGFDFGPSINSIVMIPYGLAKEYAEGSTNITEIEVRVASDQNIKDVVRDIKQRLKDNHAGTQDFTVTTAEDQLKVFDQVFSILTSFIAAIAAISLLVGGIGVMNIMLVSVSERTREIGIRKAIGATRTNILMQFLSEAIMLSLLGGVLGFGLAFIFGLIVKSTANISPVYTLEAFVLAFGVSLFVGVVFGVAPAIKAARKRPIQALKAL